LIERICQFCGKKFKTYKSEVNRGGGKYCSQECYHKSQKGKKKKFDPEKWERAKKLISEKAKERIKRNGHPRGFLGKRHTDETKKKIGEKLKGESNPMKRPETRKKMSEIRKRNNPLKRPEVRRKISEAKKGKPPAFLMTDEGKRRQSIRTRERNLKDNPAKRPEVRRKISEKLKGRHNSPNTEFTSERLKLLWKDPNYRNKVIKNSRKIRRPTSPEVKFIEVCEKYNLPFVYTGSGKRTVVVGNRVPDFVHRDKKVVVEILGTYWHSPLVNHKLRWDRTAPVILDSYRKNGWKCILIWDYELEDEKSVVGKLKEVIVE